MTFGTVGLEDEIIRNWWSKVTVTSQNTFFFGCNSRIHTPVMTKFLNKCLNRIK